MLSKRSGGRHATLLHWIGSMIFVAVSIGCATKPPLAVSVEACYHAVLTDTEAAALRRMGWPLVQAGDLVVSRTCEDEDIAALADQVRALTHNDPDSR